MLLSVNVTSPDYPDEEYIFDMYARSGVTSIGGHLHRVAGKDIVQVTAAYEGDGCDRMSAIAILESLQKFALGQDSGYPFQHFGRQFFGHTGEEELALDVSATFVHQQRYWSFGLSYLSYEHTGEWLYEEYPDEQERRSVYHRWIDADNSQGLVLGRETHSWPNDQGTLSPEIDARLTAKEHAITLLIGEEFPPEIRIAREWLTEQLVFVGKATRKASLCRMLTDLKDVRRLCRRLLPVIGSQAIDIHYGEVPVLEFLNSYERNQDRGEVEEWTDHHGTVHWLYPNAFMALKIVDNQPLVLKLGFELEPAPIIAEEEQLQEFSSCLPPDELLLSEMEDIVGEYHPDDPDADAASTKPPEIVFRIPFGALNPRTEAKEGASDLEDDYFNFDDFDDFDFDDFDLEDINFDFDDEPVREISVNERELIQRFPDFDLAMTDGKVVIWEGLRETVHGKMNPVADLLDYMVREGIAGQFIYSTRDLNLVRSSVIRHGDLWYTPAYLAGEDGEAGLPISWQRINDALVTGNDASVRSLLSMMFTPPAREENRSSGF